MTPQLKIFAVLVAVLLLAVIVDLVRRRLLREEYSWLWILAGLFILALAAMDYEHMVEVGRFFGGIMPSTILYLFAILLLVVINIHFSVKISALHRQVKNLAQELALLQERALQKRRAGDG